MALLTRDYKDMIFADFGPFWRFQRKLAHTALRSYGEGVGNTVDDKIRMESEALNQRLSDADGKPVDVHIEFGIFLIFILV